MIWQQPEFSLNPRLRVKEAIREGDQIEERILRELGIEEDWMNRFPTELSGGAAAVQYCQGPGKEDQIFAGG